MPCPECNDVQLATMCSVLASARDTCTSKNGTTGRAYVTAASAPRPGTDLHHIQKAASITMPAAYGSRSTASVMPMPDHLMRSGYGGKLTGLSAGHQSALTQRSLESTAYEQDSMSLGDLHAQRSLESSMVSANFLGGRAKRAGGTRLNGSVAF
jgi:hypothetical protein